MAECGVCFEKMGANVRFGKACKHSICSECAIKCVVRCPFCRKVPLEITSVVLVSKTGVSAAGKECIQVEALGYNVEITPVLRAAGYTKRIYTKSSTTANFGVSAKKALIQAGVQGVTSVVEVIQLRKLAALKEQRERKARLEKERVQREWDAAFAKGVEFEKERVQREMEAQEEAKTARKRDREAEDLPGPVRNMRLNKMLRVDVTHMSEDTCLMLIDMLNVTGATVLARGSRVAESKGDTNNGHSPASPIVL